MPRLAESSVVIAFRDWQWKHRPADAPALPFMIVMEGNAESMLGDLQISAADRFFLLEVKSTQDTIHEEWSKWNYTKNKPNPKLLFKRLCTVLSNLGSAHDASGKVVNATKLEQCLEFINSSIASHHFLYWNETDADFQIEPYYFGCLRNNGFDTSSLKAAGVTIAKKPRALSYLSDNIIGLSQSPLWQDESLPIHFEQIPFILPKMLNDKSARLISDHSASPAWQFFGLEFNDFDSYVQLLCSGASYKTNCVVMSSSGKIFAHIVDTTDLITLMRAIRPCLVPADPAPEKIKAKLQNQAMRASKKIDNKAKPDANPNIIPRKSSSKPQ